MLFWWPSIDNDASSSGVVFAASLWLCSSAEDVFHFHLSWKDWLTFCTSDSPLSYPWVNGTSKKFSLIYFLCIYHANQKMQMCILTTAAIHIWDGEYFCHTWKMFNVLCKRSPPNMIFLWQFTAFYLSQSATGSEELFLFQILARVTL